MKLQNQKILFLDVDGVLNTQDDWIEAKVRGIREDSPEKLNLTKVALLEYVLKKTEANFILSSDWRHYYTADQFFLLLQLSGFSLPHERFLGNLPAADWRSSERGRDIDIYLAGHPEITKWVAVDDVLDNFMEAQYTHVVETNPELGLTSNEVHKLIFSLK